MSSKWLRRRHAVQPDTSHASHVLDALAADATAALTRSGRIAILLGPAGAGKSQIVASLLKHILQANKNTQVVCVDCARAAGHDLWADVVHELTFDDRLKATGSHLARTWVSLVPIAGPIISAAATTFERLRNRNIQPEPHDLQRAPVAVVGDLLKFHPLQQRCIIADHVEHADAGFVAGAAALQRRLPETRTFMLLVIQTDAAGRMSDSLNNFVLEAERAGICRRFHTEAVVAAETDIAKLTARQHRLLQLAATCGRTFYSVVVAELADLDELLVEDELAALTRLGVLRHHPLPPELQLVTSQHSFINEESVQKLANHLPDAESSRVKMEAQAIAGRHGLSDFETTIP